MHARLRAVSLLTAVLLSFGGNSGSASAESDWIDSVFPKVSPTPETTRRAKPAKVQVKRAPPNAARQAETRRATQRDHDAIESGKRRQAPAKSSVADSYHPPPEDDRQAPATASAPMSPQSQPRTDREPLAEPQAVAATPATASAPMRLGIDPTSSQPPETPVPPVAQVAREAARAIPPDVKATARDTPPHVERNAPATNPIAAAPPVPAPAPVPASGRAPASAPTPALALAGAAPRPPRPTDADNERLLGPEARTAAVERGKRLWHLHRGSRHASMADCDLGLGPGRVVGTFAHMPRYFADAEAVMDAETRIAWCARTLQGLSLDALRKPVAVDGVTTTELTDLALYVASLSTTWRLSPATDHPRERTAQAVGEALYTRRQGPFDFSCAACHAGATRGDTRPQAIRIWQGHVTPRLGGDALGRIAVRGGSGWLGAAGDLQTTHGKIDQCYRRMGVEPPAAGSDPVVALVAYLTHLAASGEAIAADGKR